MSLVVMQAIQISKLRRALQKIADLPTTKLALRSGVAPILRAQRIAVTALGGKPRR